MAVSTPIIKLEPAVYSKTRQVSALVDRLKQAPAQRSNTIEAIEGKVADFVLHGTTRPYGTLSEFADYYAAKLILILCADGKVYVSVEHNETGRYFKVRGFSIA